MSGASTGRPDSVGVVGTGLMGSGIAAVICSADKPVKIFDLDAEKMANAWTVMRSMVDQLVEYGIARAGKNTDQLLERITVASDYRDFRNCHMVIEAVVEDAAVKREVYKALEDCLTDDAIIASNTSNIVPSELVVGMRRPERFVVTHFWNPPHSVPLVEIVPHATTAPWCIDRAVCLINEIGNDPVVLRKEVAGFIGNRLQYALLREAMGIVQQGIATPAEVDRVMTASLGPRYATVGPFATADLGGLDTFLAISQQLVPQLVADNTPLDLLQRIVARGDYGAKSGRGFLDWPDERRAKIQELRDTDLLKRKRGGSGSS